MEDTKTPVQNPSENLGGGKNFTGSDVGLFSPKELFEMQQDMQIKEIKEKKEINIPPPQKQKFGERINNPSLL